MGIVVLYYCILWLWVARKDKLDILMAHNAGYSPVAKTGEVLKISCHFARYYSQKLRLSVWFLQRVIYNSHSCANTGVLFSVNLCLCTSIGRGEYSNGCGVLSCTVATRTHRCLCVCITTGCVLSDLNICDICTAAALCFRITQLFRAISW